MISGPGDQAANVQSGLFLFIAAHGAVALFDPPANGAFAVVIRAIYHLISIFILPITIESQARPKIPPIHKQIPHPIGNVIFCPCLVCEHQHSADSFLPGAIDLPNGGNGSSLAVKPGQPAPVQV